MVDNTALIAVPGAQNLHDRLTNLSAAKADLDRELRTTKKADPGFSLAAPLRSFETNQGSDVHMPDKHLPDIK